MWRPLRGFAGNIYGFLYLGLLSKLASQGMGGLYLCDSDGSQALGDFRVLTLPPVGVRKGAGAEPGSLGLQLLRCPLGVALSFTLSSVGAFGSRCPCVASPERWHKC